MKKRSFLATVLVLGAIASGGATTMAVTGQFSAERAQAPTASTNQYVSCKTLVRGNRADERSKARTHRRAERRIRNPRTRRQVRRIHRNDERQERRAHRREERRCRAGQH